MKGNKIVEIKAFGSNKGVEVSRLMEHKKYDFILAMGDDITDEDMFHSLPEDSITVKVGSFSDKARYFLKSPIESVSFLNDLTGN